LDLIRLDGPTDVLDRFKQSRAGHAIGYFKGHEDDVRVFLTDRFPRIQEALGYSLTETSNRTYKSVVATPMFNGYARKNVDVFILMPFAPAFDNVHAALVAAAKGASLNIVRGDDLFGSSYVIDDIWSCMLGAKYVIADCTGTNPNVMYELGIAHTLGRPTLLVSQSAEDIPFDLRHWRYHLYSPDELSQLTATVASFVGDDAHAA
jgi:hypothetical protein